MLADVHLGYGWALRRRGQLGPVGDAGLRCKLLDLAKELQPASIVFLGDLVHAPRPVEPERQYICTTLQELSEHAKLVVVRGNHDRGLVRDFANLNLEVCSEWRNAGIVAVHGDRIPAIPGGHLVVGHLHPALGVVDDAGATQRIPVFLAGSRLTVLPAFSTLAAGFDVRTRLPEELAAFFGSSEPCVIAASGQRAIRLGPLSRLRST